jgi:hypothetical protein
MQVKVGAVVQAVVQPLALAQPKAFANQLGKNPTFWLYDLEIRSFMDKFINKQIYLKLKIELKTASPSQCLAQPAAWRFFEFGDPHDCPSFASGRPRRNHRFNGQRHRQPVQRPRQCDQGMGHAALGRHENIGGQLPMLRQPWPVALAQNLARRTNANGAI